MFKCKYLIKLSSHTSLGDKLILISPSYCSKRADIPSKGEHDLLFLSVVLQRGQKVFSENPAQEGTIVYTVGSICGLYSVLNLCWHTGCSFSVND